MQNEHGKWDEATMRETEAERPQTTEALAAYVERLVGGGHDYGTCVYAMSLAAVAAFNLVAHKLGVTGFQASCADMDILRRTRRYAGPFAIIDSDKMLYPQYDIPAEVDEMLGEWAQWAADEARKKLAERNLASCAGAVVEHWQMLAASYPPRVAESTAASGGGKQEG